MDDEERIERDAAACQRTLNLTAPLKGVHCPGTFDSWTCWPPTVANATARAPCPTFVPGFSETLFAHKECDSNGSWWRHPDTGRPWSNYTTCVAPDDDVSGVILVYEAGYGVSLVALILSLGILWRLRGIRCARITVHMHLFASFAINNALWLWWYRGVVRSPPTLAASPVWCLVLAATLQYALLTTYTWTLCEGLYLHTVLVWTFVPERRLVRALVAAGWALPLPSAIAHAALRASAGDRLCWLEEGAPRPELAAVAVAALALNACFLCNIVRVVCGKLRGGAARSTAGGPLLHAVRATCLLAPLLGLQYLLVPFRPERSSRLWVWYEYVSALVSGLQGLLVSLLYCFCNGEVLTQLRRRWRVLTFRPRANSATATTMSLVRSHVPPIPPASPPTLSPDALPS